ncbi:MAG: chitobiase/beta-hexosaminidase C-terminal domain-containing protein [Parcubacteria group bacterium]|nr:chitobiase/beta-hexosaminidase C-terminal domain-containing protein [Parcubacteria group bacterium]MCR4342737.1 chitobiase/beta-hexosaminidase C-terminal domain-containing protein [Patescibacteria group bacterium]
MRFSKDKNLIIKKYITGFLLALTVISSSAYVIRPRPAEAFVCGNCSQLWNDFISNATDINYYVTIVKDNITKTVWAIFRKKMIDYMTDELVKWVQGGGNPKFVTDFNGFLAEVADEAGGQILEEMTNEEFMRGLCQPDWAIRIRIGLQKPKKFSTKARCTLSDIGVNFNDFMDNFNNGGWKGWLSVSESQNNPYGLYTMTLNEKLEAEAKAKLALETEVKTGYGFLSDKVCKEITVNGVKSPGNWKMEDVPSYASCSKVEVRTPGKMVSDAMNYGAFKDIDWLISSDEWQNIVVAVTDAAINRLTKEGVMALKSGDKVSGGPGQPDVNSYMDITPPVSTASVFDPWHISLKANEALTGIYYTLDGSDPTTFSTKYSSPISIVSSTNLNAPLSPLKWFAIDKAFNEENIRTLEVSSPFSVPGRYVPSTVEVAVNPTSVTLLSNEPAIIYYTIDGTEPDTFSQKFIKQIDLNTNESTTIRWFAVDQGGNREATHTLSTQPLFPNNELPYIVDLVTPTPAINAPASASINSQFTLDPSSSADIDRTPQIAMYEWDFDNDGVYDWKTVDYNRDGIFDEQGCRMGINCSTGLSIVIDGSETGIGNGFRGMSASSGATPGTVSVSYSSGQKTISLRVTDNEGLQAKTSVTINVN